MRSNNPVFNRSPEFNGQSTYAGNGQAYGGYGQANPYGQPDPYQTQGGQPGYPDLQEQGRMTIDSVVQKTGITLLTVIAFAAATWMLIGDVSAQTAGMLYGAMLVGGGAAFVLSLVNSFKRVISPGLVLAFAAAEGVALGAFSKFFDAQFGGGIVVQAVLGTFAALAGTLAAYKFFNITVSNKFRKFVVSAMFGMVALGLLEMVLGMFGNGLGLFDDGALGLLFAVAGLVLGVFMLLLDFDFAERGVAAGLAERESWRVAFGLTVSLVWIYTNLLRILAIFQQD